MENKITLAMTGVRQLKKGQEIKLNTHFFDYATEDNKIAFWSTPLWVEDVGETVLVVKDKFGKIIEIQICDLENSRKSTSFYVWVVYESFADSLPAFFESR